MQIRCSLLLLLVALACKSNNSSELSGKLFKNFDSDLKKSEETSTPVVFSFRCIEIENEVVSFYFLPQSKRSTEKAFGYPVARFDPRVFLSKSIALAECRNFSRAVGLSIQDSGGSRDLKLEFRDLNTNVPTLFLCFDTDDACPAQTSRQLLKMPVNFKTSDAYFMFPNRYFNQNSYSLFVDLWSLLSEARYAIKKTSKHKNYHVNPYFLDDRSIKESGFLELNQRLTGTELSWDESPSPQQPIVDSETMRQYGLEPEDLETYQKSLNFDYATSYVIGMEAYASDTDDVTVENMVDENFSDEPYSIPDLNEIDVLDNFFDL